LSLVSPSRLVVLALSIAMLVSPFMSRTVAADIPPGGEYGGNIRIAVLNTDAIDEDPNDAGASSQIVHQLVYDSLARMSSDDYLPEPWLASGWAVNGNTITFQMRSGAKWSDGTNLTVSDIAYDYNQTIYAGHFAVMGAGTIAFTLPTGGGRFMGEGIYLPIAHKNNDAAFSFSGPYYANDTTSPDHFTVATNLNHWRGRPYLDYIRYDYYSNMSLAACAFIDRKATFMGMALSDNDVNSENWPCNKRIVDTNNPLPQLFNSLNPGLAVIYMGMNDAPSSPLSDPAVRLAITRTIDRDGYAGSFKDALISKSELADSFISQYNTYWFNSSIPKYRVPRQIVNNLETKIFDAINADLEAAGYMDWNFDGWREKPNGQPLNLTLLLVGSNINSFKMKGTLMNDIQSIGLRISERSMDTEAEVMSEVQSGNFTLYLGTLKGALDPNFLRDYFYSTEPTNYFDYDSTTMDGYLDTIRNSFDVTTRQKAARDAQNWISMDVPSAPILHMKAVYVFDKLVYEGWVNQLGGINNFWSFYNLHAIPRGSMSVDVSILKQGNRLNSGESTTVQVAVTNESGAIIGADVEIIVTNGVLGSATGMTDSQGWYRTSYVAAAVDQVTDVFLTARVTKAGHTETWGQSAVAVYPGLGKLEVGVVLMPNKRNLASDEEVELLIEVTDSLNSTVKIIGANVTITIVPDGVGEQLTAYQGFTNSVGRFTTKFKASVNTDVNFALRITVTYAGYEDKATSLGIIVSKSGTPPPTPGPDVIVIVAVVTVLAFSYGMAKRSRRKDSG
jgi:ABC-type transport system substrate-binding protein